MTHWLLAASLLLAPPARVDDDTISQIEADVSALFKKVNEEKRQIKEEDLLPLIDRCWKVYDQNEGEPIEFDALNEVLTLSTSASGKALEEQWLDAAKKMFAGFSNDDRIAANVLYFGAPTKLRKDADAMIAQLEKTTRNENVKAAFDYKKVLPLLDQDSNGALDEKQHAALVAQLEKLARDHANASVPQQRPACTYEAFVKQTLYMMEHLKIGAVAPEIEAKDLDGVAFKLSDYRGKVVMLDFWGYW